MGVSAEVRIFSGGHWLVGSVVGSDNFFFFFLGDFGGVGIGICG